VWFKENNPGHRFEAGLVATLARIAPHEVIVPLAVDRERGWLLADDQGTTLTHPDVADQPTRCIVVRALARLQCSLLGRVKAAGMLALPPYAAGDRMRLIAREWAGLPPDHPLRLSSDVLRQAECAAAVLDRRTACLSDAVPLDLEINDVYAANIFADRSSGKLRPRFFDFGNAIWGHPFVSVHGFLESVVEWTGAPLPSTDREALYDVYLAEWRDHLGVDPHVLRDDLAVTEALVNVHRLVSWARLIPYADSIELTTRAEIPLKFLSRAAASK
jgi:hypothetical protein